MNNKAILTVMLILGLVNVAGCNSDNSGELADKIGDNEAATIATEFEENDAVATASQQALANDDYRLLHSKGRRIVVPGFEHIELSLLESQCGIKPMTNSSDVMKSSEQKTQRKAQYVFAKQFNQMMYAKCLTRQVK